MFNYKDIVLALGKQGLKNELREDERFNISTDTRTIKSGDIYLPLKGETFDGEKFIEQAVKSGAIGYFTTGDTVLDDAKIVFKVENTTDSYLKLAKYKKTKLNPITIGITGSSGKTTTKELIYSVLSQKFRTHKTFSNHNNEIGFCQTVMTMPEDTQVLIVEMGMRGLGEIELIAKDLSEDFAVITNSGSAHVGRLGSLDNIAKAKCEIAKCLKPEGIFIGKNQDIIKRHLNFSGKKIFYSLENVNILKMSKNYTEFIFKGEKFTLSVEGEHNVENSLAAIELGLLLNMTFDEIRKGLISYKPIEKRWEIDKIGKIDFINDSYNANPESMKASVKTFVELYENPVVVLGDMGELGEDEVKYHIEVGKYLSTLKKDVKYLLVGNLASKIGNELEKTGFFVKYFKDNDEVSCYILENHFEGNTIFLKASRSMKFEQILEKVKRGINKI